MWTLDDLLNITNGSSLIKNESSFEFSFGKKKLNFISCTNTLKAIGNMYTTETFHSRPSFAKYAKVCFVEEALNKKIKSCNMVLTDPHSLAEKYNCDSSSRTCLFSENECYFTGVTMDDSDDVKWAKVNGKVKKVIKSVDVEKVTELFN